MDEGDYRGERPGNAFERMLWEIAGEPVRLSGIVLIWAAGMSIVAGTVYVLGGRTESSYFGPFGLFSAPYWAIGVPAYVRRKYRGTQ
jgi:hypothetical protein